MIKRWVTALLLVAVGMFVSVLPAAAAPAEQASAQAGHALIAAEAKRGAGDGYAARVLAGGRADGETVFAGHGEYRMTSGTTVVPEGTSVTTYAPHGMKIGDSVGGAIETGGGTPFQVYGPGEAMPNYTLKTPDGLTVYSGSTTVDSSTLLSDLLEPGMGNCHWAACLNVR